MSTTSNRTLTDVDARRQYEQLVANIDGIVWEADARTFQFTFVSEQAERLLGYPLEQWLAPGFWPAHLHPDDHEWALNFCLHATRDKRNHDFEYRMLAADGRTVWLRDIVSLVIVDDEVTKLRGIMVDVTDRKRAEAALTLFRSLLDQTNDAIEIIDPETGRFLDVNEQACLAHGYTRAEYLALTLPQIDPGLAKRPWEELRDERRRAGSRVFESQHRRKDGSVFPVEVNVTQILLDREYQVAVVRDITERKRAERALVESHALLNAVVEGTADTVFLKDLDGRYLMINSAGAQFLGMKADEIIGKDDRQLFRRETALAIMERDRQVMSSGLSQVFEEPATVGDVTRTYLSTKGVYRNAHGVVVGLIGISRDVTELKRLEEQFRQAQKMEAVGQLAGGVAHDFSNLLTVINGYSELVFSSLDAADPNRELVAEIWKSGERAVDLTRKLLAFSRKQMLQPQVVNVNSLLDELHKLLQRLIGADIELSLLLAPDLALANVDPSHFEQAILNLAVNARDAMPKGGRLIIETRNVEFATEDSKCEGEVRAGNYVLVSVRDTGHGMDEATKRRVFDPFFTTKGPGKGTGLGLAMVYGFVKQSGGQIDVSSEPGHGAAFNIYLPHGQESPRAEPSSDRRRISKGTETVLLVEDEDAVRNLAKLSLQSSGYRILEARDGQEAVWVAEQHQGPIHALVTDVVMPRMSGRHLATLLTQARPGVRVLFMSGYADDGVPHAALKAGAVFLQKPFSPISLVRTVRNLLDASELRPGL